jgi:hypothetical protein
MERVAYKRGILGGTSYPSNGAGKTNSIGIGYVVLATLPDEWYCKKIYL